MQKTFLFFLSSLIFLFSFCVKEDSEQVATAETKARIAGKCLLVKYVEETYKPVTLISTKRPYGT